MTVKVDAVVKDAKGFRDELDLDATPGYPSLRMPRIPVLLFFALGCSFVAPVLVACGHKSSTDEADGGDDADEPGDAAVIPLTCGNTGDCQQALLDADTCVYEISLACGAVGHCIELPKPSAPSLCSKAFSVGPCSGSTFTVPACWQGYSPVAVQSEEACPPDSGSLP